MSGEIKSINDVIATLASVTDCLERNGVDNHDDCVDDLRRILEWLES